MPDAVSVTVAMPDGSAAVAVIVFEPLETFEHASAWVAESDGPVVSGGGAAGALGDLGGGELDDDRHDRDDHAHDRGHGRRQVADKRQCGSSLPALRLLVTPPVAILNARYGVSIILNTGRFDYDHGTNARSEPAQRIG